MLSRLVLMAKMAQAGTSELVSSDHVCSQSYYLSFLLCRRFFSVRRDEMTSWDAVPSFGVLYFLVVCRWCDGLENVGIQCLL